MHNEEKLIGTIRVDSGTLLLVDGVFDSLGISSAAKTRIELPNPGNDGVILNVFKADQNGEQFLIIPLSATKPISYPTSEYIPVEGIEEDDAEQVDVTE
jgi:hypothetical protein